MSRSKAMYGRCRGNTRRPAKAGRNEGCEKISPRADSEAKQQIRRHRRNMLRYWQLRQIPKPF